MFQYSTIGTDNGLAPARRQAIIWTNGGIIHWRIYPSLGLNELTLWPLGDMTVLFNDFQTHVNALA